MGFPPGMALNTIAFGIPLTITGKDVVTKLTVKPTSRVIWAATGQPLPEFSDSFTAEAGQLGQFQVPAINQPGFIDSAGNEVTDFAYQINASWEFANERPITWSKNIKPLLEQTGVIDLDLVPDGPVSIPVTAPTAAMLGFNGRTGFVTLQESDLPQRLSVADLSATNVDQRVRESGWHSPLDFGAVPAVVVKGATVTAASTTVTAAPGSFTADMTGDHFYIRKAGAVQVSGTRAWENAPLYGTVTYVSSSQITLSIPAVTSVAGAELVIGTDATDAFNEALALGECRFPDGWFIIAGQIIATQNDAKLRGAGYHRSHLASVTARANGPIFAMIDGAVAEHFSWWGNGAGDQPADTSPTTPAGVITALANSGCGVTFAAVHKGTMRSLRAYHCGGKGQGAGTNGIAGIYETMGCQDSVFEDLESWWCRNGFNCDAFFAGSNPPFYAPQRNTYHGIRAYFCRYGVAWEPGIDSRDLVASNVLGYGCSLVGVELHSTIEMTLHGPRGENNELYGINVYGHHASLYARATILVAPYTYGNGVHGLRFGDFARDNQAIGGISAMNGNAGLAFSNGSRFNRVDGLLLRLNAQGGATAEVQFSQSSDNFVRVKMDQVVTGWAHTYAVSEQNSSGSNTIAEDSVLIAGSLGVTGYKATASTVPTDIPPGTAFTTTVGTLARRERARIRALGMRGETFPRHHSPNAFVQTAGDQRAVLIGLNAGDTIGGIYAGLTSAATVTLVKMGIWDSAGVLLASTADVSANFGSGMSGSLRGGSLATPWVAPATGAYYIGMVTVGTTGPTILRAASSGLTNFPGAAFNGGLPESISVSGQTDIAAFTIGGGSSTVPYFCWT